MNVMMLLEMASAAFPNAWHLLAVAVAPVIPINSYLTQRGCVLAQSKPVARAAW